MMQPSLIKQYLPSEITTADPVPVRLRSPRMIALLAMIVLPPSIIFCGPAMVARRETLLPVSCTVSEMVYPDNGVRGLTVSMYSPYETGLSGMA